MAVNEAPLCRLGMQQISDNQTFEPPSEPADYHGMPAAACRGLDLLEFTTSVFGARTLTMTTRRLEGAPPPPRRVPGMLSAGAAASSVIAALPASCCANYSSSSF